MGDPLVDAEPPIRVAVLASVGGARLRYLLEDDPNHGELYELVGGFVNVADGAPSAILDAHGVPVETRDIHAFYDDRDADIEDMAVREAYDTRTVDWLATLDPHLVVLSGYLHVITSPVLDRFFPRIVNAHHADLTIRTDEGDPAYPGLHATADAIRAGESTTRETTHLVTKAVDAGPILVRSPPFEVHRDLVTDARSSGADDVLDAYVYAHRGWMIREGGGPTLAKTIELIAAGRVTYDAGETRIDDRPGYYQLGEGVIESPLGDGERDGADS